MKLGTNAWQRNLFIATFIIPTFLFFCVFTVYPVLQAMYYSLYDWSGSSDNKTFIGLDNFKEMLHDPIIWIGMGNDYFLVAGKIIGIMILATFLRSL